MFYKNHIFFCTNERVQGHERGCCNSKGSIQLWNYMKLRAKELKIKNIRINKSGCLDRCKNGPVIVNYPEGNWYKIETKKDVDEFLQEKFIDNKEAERLKIENEE